MKIATILFILFGSLLSAQAQTFNPTKEKIKILILSREANEGPDAKELNGKMEMLENIVAETLSKDAPCVEIITKHEIAQMLEKDRWEVLLGQEGHFSEIAGALGCDYMISISISKIGERYFLNGSVLTPLNAQAKVRKNRDFDTDMAGEFQRFANDIVRELLAGEICPYTGDLTYTSTFTHDELEKRTGLPDAGCDFEETTVKNNLKQETWIFKKVNRMQAEGNVDAFFTFNDETNSRSNCLHCQVMEGEYLLDVFEAHTSNTTKHASITETYNAKGLAFLDPQDKREKYHAIIRITFDLLANNYTLTVKAISQPGKYSKKTVFSEKGCPYYKDWDNETGGIYPVSINRTFGPFTGSPYEKNLKKTDTKTFDEESEKGTGKTIETVKFNLTR
jgi:hypothetical protein